LQVFGIENLQVYKFSISLSGVGADNMKHVVSISLEEDTILKIRERLRNSIFRSKSHLVEEAIKEFLRCDDDS
jgi:hypothetical protein